MCIKKSVLLLSLSLAPILIAEAKEPPSETGTQAERALSAANVLTEIVNAPDSSIPQELLEQADAIGVIPNVVKAALGVGGSHGKGLIAKRIGHRWGTPAFIDLSGGSFGFQIGVSSTDLILVFTNEDGLRGLFEDKLELGGEAGVAAGPVGRTAEAGTNITFDSPIYSYSRSKGLFAGVALKGAVMTIDDSANHKVYGSNVSGRDILLRGGVSPSPVVEPFLAALEKHVTPAMRAQETGRSKTVEPSIDQHDKAKTLSSADIKEAQRSLRDKGYYSGKIDGIVGPASREAIRKYQKAENIQVTGHLDAETATRLGVAPKSVGSHFENAATEVASGGREAGQEIEKGKPVAAGKELGKGVGRGAKEVGKGVADAVDPEDEDNNQEEEANKKESTQ